MKRVFVFSLILLLGFSTSSCELNDDNDVNFYFTSLQTVSSEFPEAFELNETYTISVTYLIPDNCTFFEGFDILRAATTTREVFIIGSVLNNQEDCEERMQEVSSTFRFQVIYDEPYLFRLWTGVDENGENQYIEVEVPVNP